MARGRHQGTRRQIRLQERLRRAERLWAEQVDAYLADALARRQERR